MSTRYFLLTKPKSSKVFDDNENEIVSLNDKQVFVLPHVNLPYYAQHGLFEKGLIEWCKQFCSKDKIFLDIGAHTGTYAISLADSSGEVYAFEPQRDTYYALCGGVALSNLKNIKCLNFGLGSPDQVGKKSLKIVSNDGGGSSLHSTSNILREEEIEIRTLDSLNLNDIGFIKMDVEENELFVLKGAEETLRRSGYPKFIFESNGVNQELFSFISDRLNYKIVQIGGTRNMFIAEKKD